LNSVALIPLILILFALIFNHKLLFALARLLSNTVFSEPEPVNVKFALVTVKLIFPFPE
jgi:hypothetical protein